MTQSVNNSVEDICGAELGDGNRWRATWTGGGYDIHREGDDHWLGLGNIPAGREWTEAALRAEIAR